MFSTGQVIFAALFCVAFTVAIVISYRKDIKRYRRNYSGVAWVMASFVTFILLLFFIKYALKT